MISIVRKTRRGFLLLEVILALAVFGVAATGFAVALHKMADVSAMAQNELQMTRILESALDEAVSIPTMEEGKNTILLAERDLEVTTEIKLMQEELQNEDGQNLQEMYLITVTAHWYQNGVTEERSASTWRYGRLYQAP